MKTRVIALVVVIVVGGSIAIGGAVFGVATSGQANGDCKMGYYTSTDPVYGGVAGQISLNKSCPGPVEGRFTGEVFRYAYGRIPDGIHSTYIAMKATCTATGGFVSPCTVGQVLTAAPGSTLLSMCNTGAGDNCQAGEGTRGMNMVWSSLPRGVWSFEVEATANGADWLGDRTFTVEAFNG